MGVKNVGQEIGSEEMLGKKLGVDKCWVRKRELRMWGKKLGVRKCWVRNWELRNGR